MKFDDISKKILVIIKKSLNKQYTRSSLNYLQMNDIIKNNSNVILLDVRSVQEFNEGHLNGAINIPLSELKTKSNIILNKNDLIICYCQVGERSKKAVNILNKLGFSNVYTLEGGLDGIN